MKLHYGPAYRLLLMQPRSQGLSSPLPSFSRSKKGKKRDPGNEVAVDASYKYAFLRQITAQIFVRSPIVQCSCTLVTIQTWLPVAAPLSANPFTVTLDCIMVAVCSYFLNLDGKSSLSQKKKIQFNSLKMFSGKSALKCSNNAQCFCFCLLKCLKKCERKVQKLN